MKRIILMFLMLCAVGFGAYDNTPVEVTFGHDSHLSGSGLGAYKVFSSTPKTWFNSEWIVPMDGTLTEVLFTRYCPSGSTVTSAKIVFFSKSGSNYVDTGVEIDVTTYYDRDGVDDDNADYYVATITGLSLELTAGWIPAFIINPDSGASGITTVNVASSGFEMDTYSGDAEADTPVASSGTVADTSLHLKCTMDTLEYVNDESFIQDRGNLPVGDIFTGFTISGAQLIELPQFIEEPYYIIIEDVDVPQGEDLELTFHYESDTYTTLQRHRYLHIDNINADVTLHTIGWYNNSDALPFPYHGEPFVNQAGQRLDIQIWVDPNFRSAGDDVLDMMAFYQNRENPQGGAPAEWDLQTLSLSSRGDDTVATIDSWRKVPYMSLVQNTGTGATIGKYYVARKPIVVHGDSFSSAGSGLLANVDNYKSGITTALEDAFTQKRYAWNTGFSGASNIKTGYPSGSGVLPTHFNWNSGNENYRSGDGGTLYTTDGILWEATDYEVLNASSGAGPYAGNPRHHDVCAYRDVIFCFVSGGINDVAVLQADSTELTAKALGGNIAAFTQKMASEARKRYLNGVQNEKGGYETNEVILSEIIKTTQYEVSDNPRHLIEDLCIRTANQHLKAYAAYQGLPLAETYAPSASWLSGDGLHPDTAGYTSFAEAIARAYENDSIPSIGGGSSGALGSKNNALY